jgi:hypothetical protein
MPPDPTVTMADAEVDLDDEQYDSSDDEDFTLDQAAGEDDAELSSSDDEGETATGEPAAKKRKTKAKTGDAGAGAEDAELDSGDEAMIRKAEKRKRKKKAGKKGAADDVDDEDFDDDEGGAGGFVRTRAMKMRMYVVLNPR